MSVCICTNSKYVIIYLAFVPCCPKTATIMFYVGGPAQIRIIFHLFMLCCSDLKVLLRLCNQCWRKADTVCAKYSMCRMYKLDIHLTVNGSFSFFRVNSRVLYSNHTQYTGFRSC